MRFYLFTALFFLLVAETYSLLPPRLPRHTHAPVPNGPSYKAGVIHVHSSYSDGSGTVEEIAHAANEAGLDFLILTDHNGAHALRNGQAKRYGNVDLFVEVESSTPAGHAVVYYSQTPAAPLSDADINRLSWEHFLGHPTPPGMFLSIAHPSNIKNPWNRLDRFPEGIELVNFDSLWQRELSDSVLGFATTALLYPFNNYLSALRFFEIYRKDFMAWDGMNAVSHGHFGILAQDAHAKLKLDRNWSIPWPSYLQTFRLGENVVFYTPPLASDFEGRKHQIYDSLRKGRLAILFQVIHPFDGNDWKLACGEKTFRSGDEASFKPDCEFIAQSPSDLGFPVTLQLYKDGEVFKRIENAPSETRLPLGGPGVYRLEVWVQAHTLVRLLLDRDVPYLFYNPIYVN